MTSGTSDNTFETKKYESLAFAELLKRGVLPYRNTGGGIGVSTVMGRRLELRTVPPSEDSVDGECHFSVPDFQPRPELFFLCVEDQDADSPVFWVFPSISFFVYAEPDEEQQVVRLSLDAVRPDSFADSLREYVSFFRDRWEPIVQFDHLQPYMPPLNAPDFQRAWEDFEDILMLMEFSESRDRASEERIPLEPQEPGSPGGQRRIAFTPAAREELESIPADDRDAVSDAIRSLADDPTPSGSLRLEGSPGNYRVRRIP